MITLLTKRSSSARLTRRQAPLSRGLSTQSSGLTRLLDRPRAGFPLHPDPWRAFTLQAPVRVVQRLPSARHGPFVPPSSLPLSLTSHEAGYAGTSNSLRPVKPQENQRDFQMSFDIWRLEYPLDRALAGAAPEDISPNIPGFTDLTPRSRDS